MLERIIHITIVLMVIGCVSKPKLELRHKIDVPEKYRFGCRSPFGTSDYQRYLDGYEQNYWICVRNRAEDIDYEYSSGDLAGNGWHVFIEGYRDGYLRADELINRLVETYGKEATQLFLEDTVKDQL